jgi:hypothetical protein
MNLKNQAIIGKRTIIIIGCGLLIVISLITSVQQIPAVWQGRRTGDEGYIIALRNIRDIIPQNETIAATEIYPQVTYFTDHKVEVPWLSSERALVQFMLKNNCSYLLVPEYTSEREPDSTPLLVQLAEKPFEKIADFYTEYISAPKLHTTLLTNTSAPKPDNNTSEPKPDNTPMNIHGSIKGDLFKKLFEKIGDYNTQGSVLHLYHLRSNITNDNYRLATDKTKPILSVSLPINGTVIESEFGIARVNIMGSAKDVDSNIKKVEISIDGGPFKLANPKAPDDWSTWSFSDFIINQGTKKIMVRGMDNADNRIWAPIYITIK